MTTAAPSEEAILIDHGRLCVQIVFGEGAEAIGAFAREELLNHLAAMCGQPPVEQDDWQTTIRLELDEAVAGTESFELQIEPGVITVRGGGERGLLYGAYELLERLGCRWYAPGVDHVPRRERATLPAGRSRVAPLFEYRDILCANVRDPRWLVRNRMNGHFCPIPSSMGGHQAYGLHVHTFYALVPPQRWFATHPEYFSMIDGRRVGFGAQLCLTHPELPDLVAQALIDRMRADPQHTIWSVSQNDWNHACECPDCRQVLAEEGSESGALLRFVNAVAERTSAIFPDNLISTLAYIYTIDPPRKTRQLHPNVRIRLCPIRCCQGHPFGTCDEANSNQFLQAFQGWAELTKQLYIWHYTTDFSYLPLPMPNFDELRGNVAFYRRHHVHGIFFQGGGGGEGNIESGELRGWLCAQLLRQPEADVWALVDEWLALTMGDAASGVRAYYQLFHQRVRDEQVHPSCYIPPEHPLYDGDILARARQALAGMEERAPTAFARDYIGKLQAGLAYASIHRRMSGAHRLTETCLEGPGDPELVDELDALIDRWHELDVRAISESRSLADDVRLLRGRIASIPLHWLTRGADRLAVAPALGGRIVSWQRDGREMLFPMDPQMPHCHYPYNGGYSEMVVFGPYAWHGGDAAFEVQGDGDSLTCTARLQRGVILRRRLALVDRTVTIHSELTNGGDTSVHLFWMSSLQLRLPGWQQIVVTTGGEEQRVPMAMIPDGLDHAHRVPLAATSGAWQVIDAADGQQLAGSFACDDAEAIVLSRDSARPDLCIVNVRTHEVDLQPGQTLTMRQVLR